MGKDLRGKELGVGISQRKDGLYTARFTDQFGKRRQQYFKKLQECRNWIADAKFQDEHGSINACVDMTVDAWFEYWISNIKSKTVRNVTCRNYMISYNNHIKDVIGKMLIKDVKPLHCQNVLNVLDDQGYSGNTMKIIRETMSAIFSDALENNIIVASPITKSVKCPKTGKTNTNVLTLEEQKKLFDTAKNNMYFNHFLFVLQTGVRVSELRGLKWQDIDFQNRVIHIRRNMVSDPFEHRFVCGDVKTYAGHRDIPMTESVYNILLELQEKRKNNQNKIVFLEFSDHIFLNKKGKPTTNSDYNICLKRLCKRAGVHNISMHVLRHTFATRCIESGMKPKILQNIMGHANIAITMNLYVHATEDEKEKEMAKLEELFNAI